jgi:hypothetical protein
MGFSVLETRELPIAQAHDAFKRLEAGKKRGFRQ